MHILDKENPILRRTLLLPVQYVGYSIDLRYTQKRQHSESNHSHSVSTQTKGQSKNV